MTDPVSISIIIPCYNSGETLPQTLASLRKQSYPLHEIIVIDDGSTDPATVKLLDSLTDIKLVRQENQGLPAARNTGFQNASGKYVLPLDSDDWLEPDAVEKLITTLLATPEATFAYSWLQLEDEAQGILKKHYNYFEQLFFNQMPYCILLPRAAWEEVGGYDASMRRGYEDWEFNIRLGSYGKYGVVVREPLFHYRVRSSGMLLAKSSSLHGELWQEIQKRNPDIYHWCKLWKIWTKWKNKPSSYPMALYFPWLAMHKFLPKAVFKLIFKRLLQYSQSRRVTRTQKQTTPR